jgi:hypothetical protein
MNKKFAVLLAGLSLAVVLPVSSAEASVPRVCVRLPWQSKQKCTSKLVYAKSNAPKDVRNEIERLGAILDATRTYRGAVIAENIRINAKCQKPGVVFGICFTSSYAKSMYRNVDVPALEDKESLAWLNLFYFAKEYKQYVQPRQYSTILTWGTAISKCYPKCDYQD